MGELAKIDSFKREVAVVETIEEMKLLTTKGELLAEMAKKLDIPLKGQNELGRTRIELTKKLRIVIEDKFPHGNIKGQSRLNCRSSNLKDVGISEHESSDAKIIKEEEDLVLQVMDEIEEENEVITPKKVAGEIRKKKKGIEIEETKQKIEIENSVITGKYDVIVIDPPWPYGRKYDPKNSRVASPYPELSLEEISKIELPLKDDSVVFLWTTHAFIRDSFKLVDLWKLNYKAIITWDKEKMGMGNTIRMQCEFCLLCIKGKPLINGSSERDIIREARREHSRKPEVFYLMVERLTIGKRLDYFARGKRENWDVYGVETEKF